MEVGKRIRALRTAKGLTQEELGKLLGVKKAAVQKYENGSVENLKRATVLKLAEIFDVSPSYLMGFDEIETAIHRKYYNDIITDYNKLVRRFPSNIVAKLSGYKLKTYFDGKDMNDEIIKDFKL